jgi:hypothetical protein
VQSLSLFDVAGPMNKTEEKVTEIQCFRDTSLVRFSCRKVGCNREVEGENARRDRHRNGFRSTARCGHSTTHSAIGNRKISSSCERIFDRFRGEEDPLYFLTKPEHWQKV